MYVTVPESRDQGRAGAVEHAYARRHSDCGSRSDRCDRPTARQNDSILDDGRVGIRLDAAAHERDRRRPRGTLRGPRRARRGQRQKQQREGSVNQRGIHAIASISTFTPLRGAAASTVVLAGCTPLKYSRNTRLNVTKSFMSRRNTPTLTTLASDVPAASSTLLTLSSVTRVCSARSSDTTCLVTGSSGPWPETNTKSPQRTPCAIGDSWPSENPVFGAAFVKTTSGFTRLLP